MSMGESSNRVADLSATEKRELLARLLKEKAAGALQIPPEACHFEQFPEVRQLQQQQEQIQAIGIRNPYFSTHTGIALNTTTIAGREFINFATYNYLGLSGHPAVSAAAKAAIDCYGTSVSASRTASGEKPLHLELERGIAEFIGVDDCVTFVAGHATNVTTISHLFGHSDLILYDALSHNSVIQGCQLSGARAIAFPHNNSEALETVLQRQRQQYRRVLIVIEGIYSADGDIPHLPDFIALKQRYKTFLMVDEAHSIGVLGEHGHGISEYFDIDPTDVDVWMGTLSKSFASCGGYIAGRKTLIDYLKCTAPGFVYSIGMSPANTAAALAALKQLSAEPERVTQLHQRSQFFLELAQSRGLNTGMSHQSAIVPIIVGDTLKALQLSEILFEKGINVQPMTYPVVPKNTDRLRFFISCLHTEEQLQATVLALTEGLEQIDNGRDA
jgi:8-amino-7-oxononanoate synthase